MSKHVSMVKALICGALMVMVVTVVVQSFGANHTLQAEVVWPIGNSPIIG
ncbi:hypothetical protein [Tumebacillus lipolyticus]|uniref:Uncharacterized protein n=1 Tax=Tumebacillus lipolyticus TaxID=1280370 RepID=A0ABW4ZWE0_9BACL